MDQKKRNLTQEEIHQELNAYIQNQQLSTSTSHQIETHLKSSKQHITKDQLNNLIQTFTTLQHQYKQAKKHTSTPPSITTSKTTPTQQITTSQNTKELNTQMQSIQNQLNNLIQHQEAWKSWIQHNETIPEQQIITTPNNTKTTTAFSSKHMQPLTQIPKHPEGIIVLMRWLQYLVETCGHNGLPEILDYYVDIEWITEDVRLDLMKYARGITDTTTKTKQNTLTTKDHIQTLLYLQRLNGINFDDHFLERIDWQMEKLGRDIEESCNRRTRKQN